MLYQLIAVNLSIAQAFYLSTLQAFNLPTPQALHGAQVFNLSALQAIGELRRLSTELCQSTFYLCCPCVTQFRD